MKTDNLKNEQQCVIHDVINSFNTFIATVIGGTIGLIIGIIGMVMLNYL
jgi:hypothetical protein